jgi:hypothetical protein
LGVASAHVLHTIGHALRMYGPTIGSLQSVSWIESQSVPGKLSHTVVVVVTVVTVGVVVEASVG